MLFNLLKTFYLPVLYLDPGSGSLLVQMAAAAILGIGVAVKIYWKKIKMLFTGNRTPVGRPVESEDEE